MIQFLRLAAICCLFISSYSSLKANPSSVNDPVPQSKSSLYADRLADLNLPLQAPMDKQLSRKISEYVQQGSKSTAFMLGRAEHYLPVFEQYLRLYKLPPSLKYLPIAESLLRSGAVSDASAAGLWQLMPTTARAYGLRVDDTVDERLNIHLATDAAVRILKDNFEEFGDWHLALAAYNAGSGTVRKAIRSANSQTYTKLKRFLPKETQRYVSAYLAAAYAINYYGDHGLSPQTSRYTKDPLAYLKVYDELSFRKVAKATGLAYSHLVRLNPAFRQGFIPENNKGYSFCVPAQAHLLVHHLLNCPKTQVEVATKELAAAYLLAGEKGLDPYLWLVGIRQTTLLAHNQLPKLQLSAARMALALAAQEPSLAMHP